MTSQLYERIRKFSNKTPETLHHCEDCDFSTLKIQHWNYHLQSKNHLKLFTDPEKYSCDICDVRWKTMCKYQDHMMTNKHKNAVVQNSLLVNGFNPFTKVMQPIDFGMKIKN